MYPPSQGVPLLVETQHAQTTKQIIPSERNYRAISLPRTKRVKSYLTSGATPGKELCRRSRLFLTKNEEPSSNKHNSRLFLMKNQVASSNKHNSPSRHETKATDLTFHGRETNHEPKVFTLRTENRIVPYFTRCASPRRNTTRTNNETSYTLPNETTELSARQERNE